MLSSPCPHREQLHECSWGMPFRSDGDWRKAKEGGRQPEPTREWQQHGVGNAGPGRPDRRSDGGGGVWDDEPSAGAARPRMTPAEMEEERKRMQEEFRNRKQAAVTHVDQGVSAARALPRLPAALTSFCLCTHEGGTRGSGTCRPGSRPSVTLLDLDQDLVMGLSRG